MIKNNESFAPSSALYQYTNKQQKDKNKENVINYFPRSSNTSNTNKIFGIFKEISKNDSQTGSTIHNELRNTFGIPCNSTQAWIYKENIDRYLNQEDSLKFKSNPKNSTLRDKLNKSMDSGNNLSTTLKEIMFEQKSIVTNSIGDIIRNVAVLCTVGCGVCNDYGSFAYLTLMINDIPGAEYIGSDSHNLARFTNSIGNLEIIDPWKNRDHQPFEKNPAYTLKYGVKLHQDDIRNQLTEEINLAKFCLSKALQQEGIEDPKSGVNYYISSIQYQSRLVK